MGRYPDLQTIFLSFSSDEQRLFPVSSAAPLTLPPFPLPQHSLPMDPHLSLLPHAQLLHSSSVHSAHPSQLTTTFPKVELLLPSSHCVCVSFMRTNTNEPYLKASFLNTVSVHGLCSVSASAECQALSSQHTKLEGLLSQGKADEILYCVFLSLNRKPRVWDAKGRRTCETL